MTLVDANLLIYAVNTSAPQHEEARAWLDAELESGRPVGFAWVALLAFLRLSTKVGLFPHPLSVGEANARVEAWLAHPGGLVIHPSARHHSILTGLLGQAGTGGNLVNDAHLAALAVDHGATVVSYDSDFDRFTGVDWMPPQPTPPP